MPTKNDILAILEKNRGTAVSGQDIASKLGITRSAVWKAINSLKDDGYLIESVTNKGYTLSNSSDILSFEGISQHIDKKFNNIDLNVFKEVTSTNKIAKEAPFDEKRVLITVADSQTEGRGRMGRKFFSPPGCGIYMSFLLKPAEDFKETTKMTIAASVAVKRALDKFSPQKAKIKWVNDIFVGNKKVCGILTEAVTDVETNEISRIVVGIGINVSTKYFPDDIKNIAGAVSKVALPRNIITACVINEFLSLCRNLKDPQLIKEYKEASFIIGKQVTYKRGDREFLALVKDIGDDGSLILERNGICEAFSSGEISLGSENFTK